MSEAEQNDHRDKLRQKLFDEQFELIERAYGEEAAAHANYGWGTDEDAKHLEACTKVYMKDSNMLIDSVAHFDSQTIEHSGFYPNQPVCGGESG
jgi:hypothetical protein